MQRRWSSILRAGDGTLYTADQGWSDQNRYKSTDGGAHWTVAGGSFARAFPAAATPYAFASSADGGLVIGGSSDTLMASTDRGATWRDVGIVADANRRLARKRVLRPAGHSHRVQPHRSRARCS